MVNKALEYQKIHAQHIRHAIGQAEALLKTLRGQLEQTEARIRVEKGESQWCKCPTCKGDGDGPCGDPCPRCEGSGAVILP